MNAMKTSSLTIVTILFVLSLTQMVSGQRIQGKILDEVKREPLPFANVSLLQDGVFITGSLADYDGNYVITGFDPGIYSVKVEFVGYQPTQVDSIQVGSKTIPLDLKLAEGDLTDPVKVTVYDGPFIEDDQTSFGQTLSKEDIESVATKSIVSTQKEKRRKKRVHKKQARKQGKKIRRIDQGRNQR
ncbi:MAG: carboxypeptidase regulatory-like domain-containing protein [Bacteroidota bacterium]